MLSLLLLLPVLPLAAQTVTLTQGDTGLRVEIDGKLFTEYVTKDTPRPYLYPIIGAAGESVVRNFPMKAGVPGEPADHKHHRSLWFAHGKVNGMDFWMEEKEFGTQQHVSFSEVTSSGSQGSFIAETNWMSPTGLLVMTDTRKITITALPDGEKYLDFDITLKASEGEVVLGDTKEGTMALRLCPSLSLKGEGAQGKAFNSAGDKDKNIWGKKANWVVYHGPDPKGNPVDVAIFSHPKNLRSPMTWHARDYGLFAANPFGLHDFEGLPKGQDANKGDHKMAKGDSLPLRYRFYFGKGTPEAAALEAKYQDYIAK
jgi:hypothetical protein